MRGFNPALLGRRVEINDKRLIAGYLKSHAAARRSPHRRESIPHALSARISRAGGIINIMTEQTSNLLQKALSLSEEERADLACSLLNSLDPTVDEGAAGAWDKEIARRISDLDSGQANTVSWEEVRNRLSSKLSNGKQES